MPLPTGDSQPLPAPPAVRQLDDLPSDVLYKLLAGLPAGDVVRTSVLSQAWSSRWESVPDLNIDLDDRVRDWESAAASRCACPTAPMAGCAPSQARARGPCPWRWT
jgi:hypothetical protein